MVIALAAYLAQQDDLSDLRSFIVPALIVAAPMALVVAQNDLGSALVLAPPVFFAMMYAAGADAKLLLAIVGGVILLVIAPFSYFFSAANSSTDEDQGILQSWA